MIDERKNVQTTPTRTYCKRSRSLPYSNPNKQDAPALEVFPSTFAPPDHPRGRVNKAYYTWRQGEWGLQQVYIYPASGYIYTCSPSSRVDSGQLTRHPAVISWLKCNLHMSTSWQLGRRVVRAFTLKSLFDFLIWRLKPPNQKINKSFSTSENALISSQVNKVYWHGRRGNSHFVQWKQRSCSICVAGISEQHGTINRELDYLLLLFCCLTSTVNI